MNDGFLDSASWKTMLAREDIPVADASVGVLTDEDFAAHHGRLLVWRGTPEGVDVSLREHRGEFDADVALVLVASHEALRAMLADGLAPIPQLVRRGALHPYMLMTLDGLEDAGLADFVEDLGLVFPKH